VDLGAQVSDCYYYWVGVTGNMLYYLSLVDNKDNYHVIRVLETEWRSAVKEANRCQATTSH